MKVLFTSLVLALVATSAQASSFTLKIDPYANCKVQSRTNTGPDGTLEFLDLPAKLAIRGPYEGLFFESQGVPYIFRIFTNPSQTQRGDLDLDAIIQDLRVKSFSSKTGQEGTTADGYVAHTSLTISANSRISRLVTASQREQIVVICSEANNRI